MSSDGGQPARRDHRNIDCRPQRGQELLQRFGCRPRRRVECPAMSACRRALCHQHIDARRDGRLRLRQRRHGADSHDARIAQPPAFVRARHTEGERRHFRPQIEQHVQLRGPCVVIEPGRAERSTVALRLRGQRRGVRLDCGRRARTRLWRKQIGADGPGRELARLGDPFGEYFGRQVPRGDEPEAAGVRSCGGQLRRRRPTGHRRDDDRDCEVAKVERTHYFTAFANSRQSCGSELIFGSRV